MANTGLGVTIGSHSLRAVKVRRKGEGYVVQRVFADRLNEETRPVAGRALAARGFKGTPATVGLTGRDVIIRYSQVPPVPEWRLRNLMKYEVEEVGSQSGGDVSADYRRLDLPDPEGTRSEETILVALARNDYLERQLRALATGNIKPAGGCPNSVALFNAFAVNATYTEDETSLLVNVGAQDLDIAVQKGGELLFARNATPAGKAFTEAIQQAFSTSEGKAEQMKIAKGDVTPRGEARYPDATAEKVANAIMGVAGQLASLIQSTLMIARAQAKMPDLKVDRVCLAGGGASLKGLDRYLHQAMGVPVERLDPFAISDLSRLTDEERETIEKAPHEFAVAMGLAQAEIAPAAFRLSVLPAALKRRREFATKGVWAAASALVAAGILGLIYQARTDAVAEARTQRGALIRQVSRVERLDDQMRKALVAKQEAEVKHRLLAEIAAPAALLARVRGILHGATEDAPEIYLQSTQLLVREMGNEFPYWKERRRDPGSGYEKVTRSRFFRREAEVRVVGRISGGQRPDAIYQEFVQRCIENDMGLVVETVGGYKPGRRDEDGSFEIIFRPGVPIALVTDQGADAGQITLQEPTLDDADEPTLIRGRRVDGIVVEVPWTSVKDSQRRDLLRELPAGGETE